MGEAMEMRQDLTDGKVAFLSSDSFTSPHSHTSTSSPLSGKAVREGIAMATGDKTNPLSEIGGGMGMVTLLLQKKETSAPSPP